MIRVEPVLLAELRTDPALSRLLLDYFEEAGEGTVPDPDWDRMAVLEMAGELLFLAAFVERIDARDFGGGAELVGFSVVRLTTPLAYRGLRVGWVEYIYLDPAHRAGGGARGLIAATEKAMRAAGAQRAAIHDSVENPHRYDAVGYRMAMRVWLKDLDDVSQPRRTE